MRVLFVTNLINTGGVAKVVLSYVEGCMSASNTFQCDVVAYEEPNQDIKLLFDTLGVNYYCIPRPTRNIFLYSQHLKNIIRNSKYDAMHTHIEFFNWIPCRIAKKSGIKTTVGHAHGQKGNSDSFIYHLVEALGRKKNNKYCDFKIACSDPSGRYVFGNRYELLPNFINTEELGLLEEEQRKKYDDEFCVDSETNIILGYMGYIGFQKNPKLAVEAIKKIHEVESSAVLLMAGDGIEKEEIKKLIHDYGMTDYVFLIGQRSDNLSLMQYFDYLLMPSFSEGMSIALIEAQVFGTPCIVSPGVPSNNDLHMGLFYQASSFRPEDLLIQYKKASEEVSSGTFEERLSILRQYHNDKESVISKLLSIYSGEVTDGKNK